MKQATSRVLVVGVDAARRKTLGRLLKGRGHRLEVALAADVVRAARADRPRAVVLSEGVPARDALDLCKALKSDAATRHIAVILVATADDPIDRAVARELGAETYLVLPAPELLALHVAEAIALRDTSRRDLVGGAITLDESARQVQVDGEPVDLTSVETAVLLALSDGEERVHTRDELKQRVWGDDGHDDTRLVDQYVKRLRKKLGRAGRTIQTVRGVGYRFAAAWLSGVKRG